MRGGRIGHNRGGKSRREVNCNTFRQQELKHESEASCTRQLGHLFRALTLSLLSVSPSPLPTSPASCYRDGAWRLRSLTASGTSTAPTGMDHRVLDNPHLNRNNTIFRDGPLSKTWMSLIIAVDCSTGCTSMHGLAGGVGCSEQGKWGHCCVRRITELSYASAQG